MQKAKHRTAAVTKTATQFFNGNKKIVGCVLSTPDADMWLPAIVVEEQLRGRLSAISALNPARVSDRPKVPYAYDLLLKTVRKSQAFQHLPYTAEMEALCQSWPAAVKRLRTRDCCIAATVSGFTVVTCNGSHFQPVPDVKTEASDRSRPAVPDGYFFAAPVRFAARLNITL